MAVQCTCASKIGPKKIQPHQDTFIWLRFRLNFEIQVLSVMKGSVEEMRVQPSEEVSVQVLLVSVQVS